MNTPKNWEEPTKVPLVTSCKQAARLASLSFERKLTLRETLAMRLHLMMCKTCTYYSRQIRALRSIFIRHEDVIDNTPCSCEDQLPLEAKKRIQDLIDKNK